MIGDEALFPQARPRALIAPAHNTASVSRASPDATLRSKQSLE